MLNLFLDQLMVSWGGWPRTLSHHSQARGYRRARTSDRVANSGFYQGWTDRIARSDSSKALILHVITISWATNRKIKDHKRSRSPWTTKQTELATYAARLSKPCHSSIRLGLYSKLSMLVAFSWSDTFYSAVPWVADPGVNDHLPQQTRCLPQRRPCHLHLFPLHLGGIRPQNLYIFVVLLSKRPS
jgi:hypothetical protein